MTTATAKKAAKDALDKIISKSRVHLYKPIQIAEILHHHRTNASKPFSLNDLESYRSPSKKWRVLMTCPHCGKIQDVQPYFDCE